MSQREDDDDGDDGALINYSSYSSYFFWLFVFPSPFIFSCPLSIRFSHFFSFVLVWNYDVLVKRENEKEGKCERWYWPMYPGL